MTRKMRRSNTIVTLIKLGLVVTIELLISPSNDALFFNIDKNSRDQDDQEQSIDCYVKSIVHQTMNRNRYNPRQSA